MEFGLGAIVLLLAAVGFLLSGWLLPDRRKHAVDPGSVAIANDAGRLQPYRDRQAELDRERELGNLDETSYAQLQSELQYRLLDENPHLGATPAAAAGQRWVWILAAVLPVAAVLLYSSHGDLDGWQLQQLLERSERQAESGVDNRTTLDQLGRALRDYVADDDQRLRARYLLARVDMERGEMAAAAETYADLADQQPNDAALQAQAAQAAYLAGGQHITATIRGRVSQALALDPDQPTALGLAGIDAFEQQHFADALAYWQRLLVQLPPGAAGTEVIRRGIEHARSRLGDAAPVESVPHVQVVVELGEGVAAKGTLFVFARVPGERMPLAAVRVDQPQFPLQVRLDDSNAMSPARLLSQAKQVEVVARLSRSGQVGASADDAQAQSEPLSLQGGDGQVALELRPAVGGA